jgi:hypothetical protein
VDDEFAGAVPHDPWPDRILHEASGTTVTRLNRAASVRKTMFIN